ncbi:MAG: DUF192 domain-containing protein [Rhodobacterales bacterium]|nr:DUF192 domain-containing protein [Rhodobacterales bacterium]NCT13265.1 DUF192 domain-containing protein [Rhodobacterales bacterium]
MFALALALGVGGMMAGTLRAQCSDTRVTVQGDWGRANFTVQVADDNAERAQGLMFVEEMPRMEGMLFVYERPQRAAFWMRNTLIPLDMLFADATGTIVTVHANAAPLDETPIPGGDGIQFVLEINGGLAARLGIAPGDLMQHPAIGPAAALPCAG